MVAARVDDVDLLPLHVGQALVAPEQLRVAEDGVHRCANLVRHVGQELAFRAAGAFGGILGGAELGGAARDERFEMFLVRSQLVNELLAFRSALMRSVTSRLTPTMRTARPSALWMV